MCNPYILTWIAKKMNPNTEGPLRDPRQARRISSNRDDDGDGEVMVVFENLSSGDALMGYRNEEVRRNLTSTSSNYSLSATESRTNAPNFRGSSGYSARRNESNGREIGVDKEFQPGRSSGGSWLSQEGYHADRGNGDFSKRSRRSDLQRFRSKFDKFLSEKRGLVFRPLAPDELPVLESTSDELENEGCYGVAPTLDLCLDMDVTEREREFYRTAACGDVVLTKMSSRVKAGLSLQLLCFEGKKRAFLEDLNIVVTCPNWETIPRDHYDLGKDYEVGDEIRCEIVKLNTSSREILVGMRATYASIDLAKKFPLGLVSEEELPQHYKIDRKVWQSKKKVNFNDIMNTSSGFNNPNSIGFLGSLLGIYSNHNSLTLGLSHPFPKSTLASSLRLIHNTKLAEENLNQGLNFLRSGNTAKALDSFNKTVIVDPGNIRALVSRAIIHTQEKNVVEAMRDLDVVLKRKLESTGIKKDVAQCLVSLGKLYQENSEEEKALKVYNDSMLVVPDHPDTLKLLMIIHSQIGYFTIQGLMMPKIGEFKERLNGMIEEEICKERERAAEERSVSPLAHIREVAYREAKNRQDSDTDTLLVRKKKKWKRKKSRRQSESSNASESRSDQVCSRRSSMTDCEDIEDQVNAFLAKCERDCGKVTAAIPLESVRITIAQAVPKEPEVRFIAASSAGGLDNHRIDIASTDPLYQDVNKGRSIVSLPDKFNLLTDKYGNLSTSQNIIQTVTRTQVSTSKFEMTVSSSKPTSSFVPIPTVFSSPSASSDDGAINPVASTLSKWKPVMGQALDENRTPEPELSFKTSRACNEDLERRIELVNLKVNSIEGLQNYGYREDSRSRSRSSSIPGSTFQLRSRASVKSWSRSKSKSRSRTKSRSRSNPNLDTGKTPDLGQGENPYPRKDINPDPSQGKDHIQGEGPDLCQGKGPDLSQGEGPDLSQGEGPDLSQGEGPYLSQERGPDVSQGKGPNLDPIIVNFLTTQVVVGGEGLQGIKVI
ncbi:unnamed protein product [Allacma fusca]|uniref:Tetratricopeptide repeat protein 14 n=1 Tax=Allacma fusca TaxID=39272 RepID=A0A8J2P4U2_9HEXA|nr:unnamed protein product [Allacma fusca]